MRKSMVGEGAAGRVKNEGSVIKQRSRLTSGVMGTGMSGRLSRGSACSLSSKKTMVKSCLPMPSSSNRRSTWGSDVMKDTRPLNDRAYKQRNIRNLVEFLIKNGYPNHINPKLLNSPTSKDFFRIFEFMYSFIDESYKIGVKKKTEEEIPMLLKNLGYPFNITKSSMYTISTPHTWPALLGALTWLRELIEYSSEVDTDAMLFPQTGDGPGSVPENKVFFSFCQKTYKKFLSGCDDFEEEEKQLETQLCQSCGEASVEDLREENEALRTVLEQLENEPDRLSEQKKNKSTLEADLIQMKTYASNLDSYTDRLIVQEKEADKEQAMLEEELQSVLAENERKQRVLETQEFSQDDVQRFNARTGELQRRHQAVNREMTELKSETWKQEMTYSKGLDQIEEKCMAYNKAALLLHLVPDTAENARGIDYELKPVISRQNLNTLEAHTLPALKQLQASGLNKLTELEGECQVQQAGLSQLGEVLAEQENAVQAVHTKIKRTEDKIEAEKVVMQQKVRELEAERDRLEEELSEMRRQDGKTELHQAQVKLREARDTRRRNTEKRQKEMDDYGAFLSSAISLLIDHKQAIQAKCEQVKHETQQKLDARKSP